MKKRLTILAAAGLAVLLAALAASAGLAATPLSTVTASTSGQWVKYDFKTCKYVPTKSLGDKFTAVLTKSPTPDKIAWGTQDTVFPFTLLLNASIEKEAAAAGFTLKVYDNEGNSTTLDTTQPIINAQQIVSYKPSINLWMNTEGPLTSK